MFARTEGVLVGLLEVFIVGLALSADAFAVTISNSFAYADERRSRLALMPVLFGAFQGGMPVLGYFLGGLAATLIERYAGIVTLVILGFIGGNMVREGVGSLLCPPEGGTSPLGARLTIGQLVFQAVATAIDAFAVGVSLRAESVDLIAAVTLIGLTTAACCLVALAIGRRLGCLLGNRAEVAGGIVLIIIGLQAFAS